MEHRADAPNAVVTSDVLVVRHGSAAGSVPRTSDVATDAGSHREVSPLGEGNINDDALPAGKRRVVSREPPAPLHGVIPQMPVDGAGNRSLELSSSPEQASMASGPRAFEDPRGRRPSGPRTGRGPPISRGRLKLGRDARSASESRFMVMKRGVSPSQRAALAPHRMIPECRAEGEVRDTDARIRVLEAQRQEDHEFMISLGAYAERLAAELDRKVAAMEEMDGRLQEMTARGFNFQRDLATQKGELNMKIDEVAGVTANKLTEYATLGNLLEQKVNAVIVSAESAVLKLETQTKNAFEMNQSKRDEDCKIIESTFEAMQGGGAGNIKVGPDGSNTVPFTAKMHATLVQWDKNLVHMKNSQDHLSGRVDLIGKHAEEHAGTIMAHGMAIEALGVNTQALVIASQSAGTPTCQVCGPPGIQGIMPGSSGQGEPTGPIANTLKSIISGNGTCHCIHVSELQAKVLALEQKERSVAATSTGNQGDDPFQRTGSDPWQPGRPFVPAGLGGAGGPGGSGPPGGGGGPGGHGGAGGGDDGVPRDAEGKRRLPLTLTEPLGSIAYRDKAVFDEKLAEREEYRYSGKGGGIAWKRKVENHFISRAPIMQEILSWAEEEELNPISRERFAAAVGDKLTFEQVVIVNAAIYGFLSAAVSGSAETMFDGAVRPNGLDGWRRLTHYINQNKGIRVENLRRDVKIVIAKPIPSLERIEEGIAEFENIIKQFEDAGGEKSSDATKKNDLLQVLPGDLSEILLWKSVDDSYTFKGFTDHVITMASRLLQTRRKLPLHAVAAAAPKEDGVEDFMAAIEGLEGDELLAAVGRWKARGGGAGRTAPKREGQRSNYQAPPKPVGDRPPRKCPNCGQTHADRKCPHPPVPIDERLCWTCSKKGSQFSTVHFQGCYQGYRGRQRRCEGAEWLLRRGQ